MGWSFVDGKVVGNNGEEKEDAAEKFSPPNHICHLQTIR